MIFQPMRGITILVKAINKIQLFPAQLTSIHADMCQVRTKFHIEYKRDIRYTFMKDFNILLTCTIYSADMKWTVLG